MNPSRRPPPDLDQARAAYARAREELLAAEMQYALALLAYQRERHFLCGHAGMAPAEEAGEQVPSLCPACHIRHTAQPATFTEQRRLLLRDPQPDDPG